jgi:hypothetical protein
MIKLMLGIASTDHLHAINQPNLPNQPIALDQYVFAFIIYHITVLGSNAASTECTGRAVRSTCKIRNSRE